MHFRSLYAQFMMSSELVLLQLMLVAEGPAGHTCSCKDHVKVSLSFDSCNEQLAVQNDIYCACIKSRPLAHCSTVCDTVVTDAPPVQMHVMRCTTCKQLISLWPAAENTAWDNLPGQAELQLISGQYDSLLYTPV